MRTTYIFSLNYCNKSLETKLTHTRTLLYWTFNFTRKWRDEYLLKYNMLSDWLISVLCVVWNNILIEIIKKGLGLKKKICILRIHISTQFCKTSAITKKENFYDDWKKTHHSINFFSMNKKKIHIVKYLKMFTVSVRLQETFPSEKSKYVNVKTCCACT